MRIAFVPAARLLSDSEANGESLIAVALLRKLSARGHALVAYCERSTVSIDGVEIREVSARGTTAALGRLAFARRIARDAARGSFDVAHLLFPFTTADGYSLAAGAPLICGPVNLPWPAGAARPRRFAARAAGLFTDRRERRLHDRTLHRAARLLVTGGSSLRAIPDELRNRCVELPFGVDTERFLPSPLPEQPVILFLSVLQQRKGIEVLLRAMPIVLQRVPRARLVVAGADPHANRPALIALAEELGVAGAVEFAGPVAPNETPNLYARARVFCQPSVREPFGMTVVEAMASGRPVVATVGGGIPDAVIDGEGGRLVPPGDARLLAGALCQVLERPGDAARMGAFNRARTEARYSLDHVVDRLEEIYGSVLRKERVDAPAP